MNAWSISKEKGKNDFAIENTDNTTNASWKTARIAPALYCHLLNLISMYKNIAQSYWLDGMPEKAKAAVDTAQMYSNLITEKNTGYFSLLSRITAFKSNYFEDKNMIDTAYYYLKQSNEFFKKSESIVNQEKIESDAIEFAIAKEKEKVITNYSIKLCDGFGQKAKISDICC
jgi:hypothetical protein